MPTYEYRCSHCGHQLEEFQPITAASLKKCPECGKSTLERVISGGAGILVGGASGGSDGGGESCGHGCGCHPSPGGDAKVSSAAAGARSASGANVNMKVDVSVGAKADAKAGASGAAKSGAANAGASPGAASGSASGDNKSNAGAKDGSNAGASGGASADPERDAWKSNATHQSREGRGLGNLGSILKGPQSHKGPPQHGPQFGRGGSKGANSRPPRRGGSRGR